MATLAQRITDLVNAIKSKLNDIAPRLIPSGGVAGQVLVKDSASNYDVSWGGGDGWTYLKLGSTYQTTSTTSSDVAALSFSMEANKTYLVEGVLMVRTGSTATGVQLGAAYPTNLTDQVIALRMGREYEVEEFAYNIGTAETKLTPIGHFNNTTSWHAQVSALLVASASNPNATFRMRLASETNGVAVQIRAGSFIRYRTI